ncbi:molybdopterin biosynthesis protein [Prosthecomicrobium sp. N25]|uniref:molybdopterin biosynthesis protein n=1 Tax=Prosthecomicrobium sp. N25 TaxID=3129254 RepID=UPI0030787E76
MAADPLAAGRLAAVARQEQFLEVVDGDEAMRRFLAAVEPAPLGAEDVDLLDALGRVLAGDLHAPVDAPPFDRAVVDGFALRAVDTEGASEGSPRRLALNPEVLACGTPSRIEVAEGTATVIATGANLPRGADAVVLVEATEVEETPDGPVVVLRRPAAPGQFIGSAGSDIARGELMLRTGTLVGAREIAQMAAVGIAVVPVVRRPVVAVLSTGDELVPPGEPLRPGAIYDANGAVIAATVAENGGDPRPFGIVRDDLDALTDAMERALATADMVVLSGGTSKGAGDLSTRVIARLGEPGILVHGVALKPGKPLCLAKVRGRPLVVLPGFPTSAMFTFHSFAVPVIRRMAGLGPRREAEVDAILPTRLASERGRTEYVMVSLVERPDGALAAVPTAKGSGAVTAFTQADGFVEVPALTDAVDAGSPVRVHLFGGAVEAPDLIVAGSHDLGLDVVASRVADRGFRLRILALGSAAGLAAARRGECDIAPVHLFDPRSGTYNEPFLVPGLRLVPGWRRMQGVVFRPGDPRFEGRPAMEAIAAAAADPDLVMVNRNVGSGTRALMDRELGGLRPKGWWNQPKSHNAVAAAVARGSADWGLSISTVAGLYGLGFLPLVEEEYDFVLVDARRERPAVRAFLEALADPRVRARLGALGLEPK